MLHRIRMFNHVRAWVENVAEQSHDTVLDMTLYLAS